MEVESFMVFTSILKPHHNSSPVLICVYKTQYLNSWATSEGKIKTKQSVL